MYTSGSVKIKTAFIGFLLAISVVACKKEKEPEKVAVPPPTPVVIPDQISVKVNGVEKKCSACYSSYKSGGGTRGSNFYLAGFDEQIYFGGFTFPTPGTYTLTKNGDPSLIYIKQNQYYKAVSGILNIVTIDTSSSGTVDKLTGTFSFLTDSAGAVSYTITEGKFNVK